MNDHSVPPASSATDPAISPPPSRCLPAVMILGAWLAGTLLFEISALDEIGSKSASEHWGRRSTAALPEWTERRSTHGDHDGFNRTAKPIAPPVLAVADALPIHGSAAVSAPAAGSRADAVQLSSHHSPRRRGFTIPRMIRQAVTTTDHVTTTGQSATEHSSR